MTPPQNIEVPRLENEAQSSKIELWRLKTQLWINETPSLSLLPEWLDDWDIIELTEDELNKLREDINRDSEKANEIFKKFLEDKREKITSTSIEWRNRLKSALEEAKRKAKDLSSIKQMWEWLTKATEAFSKWDIFEWLKLAFWATFWLLFWKIFWWIKDLFWFWWEDNNSDLNTSISDTEKKLKQDIADKIKTDLFWNTNLHPLLKKKLEEKVKDPSSISSKNLEELWKKLKENKKLTIEDIKSILWDDYQKLWKELREDPEILNALKLKYQKDIIDSINKEYWIMLEWDKRTKLIEILNNEFNETKLDLVVIANKLQKWESISLWDVVWFMYKEWIWATMFLLKLMFNWIIGLDTFAFNIVDTWWKLLLWTKWLFNFFWVEVKTDDFLKWIENLDPSQKTLILWLLYRKWSTLFEILWKISETWLRVLATQTVWRDYNLWLLSSSSEKIETFKKIEQTLWWLWEWNKIIIQAQEQFKQVTRNNQIIQALQDAWNDVKKAKELLSKIDWVDKTLIEKSNDIKSLKEALSKFETKHFTIWDKISWYLKNDLRARQIDFQRNIEAITSYQARIIKWESIVYRILPKIREYLNILEVWKNAERFVIEAKTKEWVLTKLDALKKLSLEAPELARSLLKGLPEIAVLWIAAWTKEENENILEAVAKVAPYLLRIVWPTYMLFSLSWAYKDWKVQWYNVTEWALWWIFLWMDLVTASKILWQNWLWWVWKFMFKPLTAPIDFVIKIWQTWKTTMDIVKAKWSWKEAGKEVLKNTKWKIKWTKKWQIAAVVWWLAIAWYWIKEVFDEDIDEKYEKLVKDWVIDERWNILNFEAIKNEFNKLDIADKESFTEIIFSWKHWLVDTSLLKFEIIWEDLKVTTNEKTIWDWCITSELKSIMEQLWIKNIYFKNNSIKPSI